MQNLLNQFKALTADEKLAFMKEAMSDMAEIFKNDPQKMMAEMLCGRRSGQGSGSGSRSFG